MNCTNCGAPLPPTSNICSFCHTLNDTDLRALGVRSRSSETVDRICPHCDINLVHTNIGTSKPLFIDRCPQCLGIFFDNGELESVVSDNVSNVYRIDYKRIEELSERERPVAPASQIIRYVKCPICRKVMNRNAYGTRSGVIIDSCREDGVWLDAGELGQISKWVKAGGRKLHERREQERQREAERAERARRQSAAAMPAGGPDYDTGGGSFGHLDATLIAGVIRLVVSLLR